MILLTLAAVPAFAQHQGCDQWIFDLRDAQLYQKPLSAKVCINLGSFKNKSNAERLYNTLTTKRLKAIHLSHHQGFYTVFVGPMKSEQEVRAVESLLTQRRTPHTSIHPQTRMQTHTKKTRTYRYTAPDLSRPSALVLMLSLGSSWAQGQSVTQTLAPEVTNTYAANPHTPAFVTGEIFLGAEKQFFENWAGQLGAAFVAAGDARLTGDIWADANPNFNNFTYRYAVSRTYIGIKGRVLGPLYYWRVSCSASKCDGFLPTKPYVSASVGLGFNHTHGYNSAADIFQEIPDAPFPGKVSTAVSYAFGAGFQQYLSSHWSWGAGYEFSDWGRSTLSSIPGQTYANSIPLDHLYNNAVLLNLSYTG